VPVRALGAIAIAVGALVLTAASTTAGAAPAAAHQLRGLVPHVPPASRFAPARRTTKAAGFNCVASCSLYESTIDQYFTDVAAASGATDNVYSVATQYSDITYGSTFGGSYVDGHPLPTLPAFLSCHDGFDKYCVTDRQLQTEIGKVIAHNGWPTQSPTTLYFIFTPANVGVCEGTGAPNLQTNPCTTNVFCAYHSSYGSSFLYAVEPDDAAVEGGACDSGQAPAGNGADATINTVSHEHIEAITDPIPLTAWYTNDANQFEIGDLCAYDFGGTPLGGTDGTEYNQVINAHNYYLQLEYSNEDSGCVPYLGGPVTAPDPLDGSGPLVDQGGPVMTTNTVYAIYWVPAPPANSQLPTISGMAKAGKKLEVSHGKWSNTPKFTYRWLRCSAVGTSCKGITKATGSWYRLVSADAHHRLEVRVTATNAAGHASAVSGPSRVVRS
jgi:hypothetical protein